ncbi:hypothetical protein EWM64_g5555 [Hericium alpestre]|uniref:Yeast cell wall synthesis Kre9/Knh1-like N-terminal domain-containing protein n=1 Tax=Hericium alpestre TaxID=135208 RepID=A0A4Y9ZY87_9AGAM|nr:hypothetical protein EWM64_g5555 [Hericium alpestre]
MAGNKRGKRAPPLVDLFLIPVKCSALARMYPVAVPHVSRFALAAVLFSPLVAAYFQVNSPTAGTQWVNGETYPMSWTKGVLDGIDTFDIELSRMTHDGLQFVAKDVPSTAGSVNVMLQDVPAGDDYFLLFLNSTHGVMYANSARFTILDSSSTSNTTGLKVDATKPTVTVSGGPDPTAVFATTFPPSANGVVAIHSWTAHALGMLSIVSLGLVGGALTVL